MSRKQKTRFALLGLLSWRPMSGYDIKKVVDLGLSHFWSANYGQIYPILDELVRGGLAEKSLDPDSGQRKRYVYQITPDGKAAFQAWLAEPTEPPAVRNELQLKFFLGSKQPVRKSLHLIRGYRDQQRALLDDYRGSEHILREAMKSDDYPSEVAEILQGSTAKQRAKQCRIFMLTLRHGILAVEARVKWCDEVIRELTA